MLAAGASWPFQLPPRKMATVLRRSAAAVVLTDGRGGRRAAHGLMQKCALFSKELEIDAVSSAAAIRRAHALMGTSPVGTLPQQADAILHALGFITSTPPSPPASPPEPLAEGKARVFVAEDHRAADKIQAAFRGRRERQRTAELRDSQLKALSDLRRQHAVRKDDDDEHFTVQLPMDMRSRLSRLLDKPRSSRGASVWLSVILVAIAASIISFFLQTMPENADAFNTPHIRALEITCAIVFTLEVLLRTCVASIDFRRLLLLDITYWIDILCIVPFYAELIMRAGDASDSADLPLELRMLQLLRLLRILKLLRHYSGWRVLLTALASSWRALLVPAFAMCLTIIVFSGTLFLVDGASLEALNATDPDRAAGLAAFDDGWEAMWVCFWLVITLGFDGHLGTGEAGGQLVIAMCLVCGLLLTTMPITIIGEAFRAAWENKELIEVQMRIQELLIERGLTRRQLHRIFGEFDTSGDMQLDWSEFKGALKSLGVKAPLPKMRKLFGMFDEDETGQVDYVEFCRLLYPDVDLHDALAQAEDMQDVVNGAMGDETQGSKLGSAGAALASLGAAMQRKSTVAPLPTVDSPRNAPPTGDTA